MTVLDVFLAVVGGLLLTVVLLSIIRTLLVPRGSPPGIYSFVDRVVSKAMRIVGRRLSGYRKRDGLYAYEGAAILVCVLGLWVVLLLAAFTLLLLPSVHRPFLALREAGASMLTLGFVSTPSVWATFVDFLAGGVGLFVVALQIAYLPTLYSAFNRRETEVTLLSARAGQPPWGPELLARTTLSDLDGLMTSFYINWERWAADVKESHASYPVLMRFRSPEPASSWIVGLLAVCDAAALMHSVSPTQTPMEARLALRMGYLCFRQLASNVGFEVDHDPKPDSDIQLSYDDFMFGYNRLKQVGYKLERTPEEAWPHFKGWRVNYESAAYQLANAVDAVPAEWAGPRSSGDRPIRFFMLKNRTPSDPDALDPTPFSPAVREDMDNH